MKKKRAITRCLLGFCGRTKCVLFIPQPTIDTQGEASASFSNDVFVVECRCAFERHLLFDKLKLSYNNTMRISYLPYIGK